MISVLAASIIIITICLLGIGYAIYNWYDVTSVQLIVDSKYHPLAGDKEAQNKIPLMIEVNKAVSEGAEAFLMTEYKYISIFLLIFGSFVLIAVDMYPNNWKFQMYTTIAYLLGAFTSLLAGYVSMKMATKANVRVAYNAISSLKLAFRTAFKAGSVLGFFLVSIALLNLTILLIIYRYIFDDMMAKGDWKQLGILMDYVAGYGLGGSTMAMFGRVGGGIYTKAADVGSDLVGKVEKDLPEDDPRNAAVIADLVGDNVGDIAGMGADLFGSLAESTSAALAIGGVCASFYNDGMQGSSLYFPLMITAFGIFTSFCTAFLATHISVVDQFEQIEKTLSDQLIYSTIALTVLLYFAAILMLPSQIQIEDRPIHGPGSAYWCTVCGLWAGLAIGYFTDYMTDYKFSPVKEVAQSTITGAATDIIYGLALGYLSTSIPVLALAIAAYIANYLLGMFGIAIAALGMLSNLASTLSDDGYGPITDNAGGIAEMSELQPVVRERTDALDEVGNTTKAMSKGFAIGSACLVAFSLFGGFVTRARKFKEDAKQTGFHYIDQIILTDPLVLAGLLFGASLPYIFSAMTMKSVGEAAGDMVIEVRRQIREQPKILTGEVKPDYARCVGISTSAALHRMFAPACLVIFTPIIAGILFGPKLVAGILPGSVISGVQMATSMANSGAAWDNTKKYIEAGKLKVGDQVKGKGSDEHKAAVIGDTVGDPCKDTSGPSLNILMKLMAIISLVFCKFFCQTGWLVCPLGLGGVECS